MEVLIGLGPCHIELRPQWTCSHETLLVNAFQHKLGPLWRRPQAQGE